MISPSPHSSWSVRVRIGIESLISKPAFYAAWLYCVSTVFLRHKQQLIRTCNEIYRSITETEAIIYRELPLILTAV